MIAGRGEIATANDWSRQELAEARIHDSPYAVAYALRTLAAVAPTNERIGLLDEALEVLEGRGAARLEAQIRTDLAGWLLLLQPTESARAVDLLRSRGEVRPPGGPRTAARTHPLAARAARRGTGRRAAGRLAELSAAERRVAQLVVLGKRNREIAVELGVSVKSVEWHVSHILRKLSITSRLDLADALAQPRQHR